MQKYNPQKIEKKWQKYWEAKKIYQANDKSKKSKYYQLETFPYPSAAGLHVGHPKGYIAEDIHARYMRMAGNEVLYTMGWDAFGLPTENYAIKVGKSPQEVAKVNIKNFRRQVSMFGFSYDWSREINTSSPEYYKWTQWLFIALYKAGLAYQKSAKVNWCPKDQTVLANEQVTDGKCERCGESTIQKEMRQWFFKITHYAERLLKDIKGLDWPEATMKRQEDWIGKSEGARLKFQLNNIAGQPDGKHFVEVFTTRPDTLFGATFIVVSPELAQKWVNIGWQADEKVRNYITKSLNKKELERLAEVKEKTGVDTGIKAVNPANKKEIPVWIADYVLGSYGTGAIMAVPAHDKRDAEFTKFKNLEARAVIVPNNPTVWQSYMPEVPYERRFDMSEFEYRVLSEKFKEHPYDEWGGSLVQSGSFNRLESEEAKWEITKFVGGKRETQYKLRDWSVSRQRYWGVPIPMIYCKKCGTVPVPEKDLPVTLPLLKDYRPKGIAPLASSKKFLEVKCLNCKSMAQRDAETLDTFVDSSWYYLRYSDPHNKKEFASKEKLKTWLPVQLYVIGAEHTTLHLLYARFISKFLYDQKYIHYKEPFLKLRHVGLIQGSDGQKMSKSRGNVVNPDEIVNQYGADAVRMYEMFMGPFEDGQPWSTEGVIGVYRFLNRVYGFWLPENNHKDQPQKINGLIKKITEDIKSFKFNTAISAFMEYYNSHDISTNDWKIYLTLLAPFAPHITEEIWQNVLKNKKSIHLQAWPAYNDKLVIKENVFLIVQINGKVRDRIEISNDLNQKQVEKIVLHAPKIKPWIEGKEVKKIIFVPNKLINIVI